MTTSHARVRTEHASEYLVQLSRDWSRDIPSLAFNDRHAVIPFPGACCELVAGEDFLGITLTSNSEARVILLEHLVDGQLGSVARQVRLKYQWSFQ